LELPKHQMCHVVRTVEALWRKWTVGLQGHPSIEVLDRK
jgi:Transcriptional activator of glycolytic enzymes